ncbi:MAG: DUF2149 domain-containing protein [Lachnospiraceae bacterium]|nr:DUF2149 domain-containing protein [Lachnospiraceae bacterium]
MRINKNGGRLRINRKPVEDINPMESVANLVDVMLVFACGLIIALIAAWNVDVAKTPYHVSDIKDSEQQEEVSPEDLQEMGRVYRDPDTGKLYVIEEEP